MTATAKGYTHCCSPLCPNTTGRGSSSKLTCSQHREGERDLAASHCSARPKVTVFEKITVYNCTCPHIIHKMTLNANADLTLPKKFWVKPSHVCTHHTIVHCLKAHITIRDKMVLRSRRQITLCKRYTVYSTRYWMQAYLQPSKNH